MSASASADRRLGAVVGNAVRAHHRRRLRRLGWLGALDAPAGGWAAEEPPARAGCSLEVLIDGAEAFTRMASEFERAESHLNIAGWFLSPEFALTRTGEQQIVRNVLAELAERIEVRVAPQRVAAQTDRHKCEQELAEGSVQVLTFPGR